MITAVWIFSVVVMLAGLCGTIIPLIPDTALILLGAVLHRFLLGPAHSVGWGTLVGLTLLTIVAHLLDFVSGSIGAKWFGASRWGAIGGILGGIIGIFFGIPGIFLGPLTGVLVGELLGGKGILPAGKSTWGTLLGTATGMVAKFGIGVLMIGWFLLAAVMK